MPGLPLRLQRARVARALLRRRSIRATRLALRDLGLSAPAAHRAIDDALRPLRALRRAREATP